MRKNAIHNFNISIEDSTAISSSEQLTKDILKELAKVSKEMSQQKDIVQEWEEQKHRNAAAILNHSNASIEGGATNKMIGTNNNPSVLVGTTPSIFEEATLNSMDIPVFSDVISNSTASTAEQAITGLTSSNSNSSIAEATKSISNTPTGEGATDSIERKITYSSTSAGITSPVPGAENSIPNLSSSLTMQTYAGVVGKQKVLVPQKWRTSTGEPTLQDVKQAVNEQLAAAYATKDSAAITYWTSISKAFDEGATVQDFNGKKDQERFTKMYFGLQKWRLTTIPETVVNNLNWGEVSEQMILKLLELSRKENEKGPMSYYKKLIREIKNPDVNVQKLFSEHDELFLLLKSLFPDLPGQITIQTKKVIYPNLSPQKMYPDIGVETMYFWSGILLNETEIKYGNGEIRRDAYGKYPDLKKGQWYYHDRVDNPIQQWSSFWKASVYNTMNDQHYFYHTIAQRHAYYKFVDEYLKTKGIISEWFDAAARVTMGSIREAANGELALGAAEMLNLWFLHNNAEEFLKGGNQYLFADNMKNVKLLLEGKGRMNGEFIDAKGKKQSFKNLSKQELDFKLVEFEQSVVQDYINSSFKNLNGSYLERLPGEVATTTGDEEFDDIVKQINNNFSNWMAPDTIEDIMEEYFTKDGKVIFDFAVYDDRVKLGQVMVKKLYTLKRSDTFKADVIDKILRRPKGSSVETTEYYIINQKYAEKEKPKHLKEYKILERLVRIFKNSANRSAELNHVGKVLGDLLDAAKEETTDEKMDELVSNIKNRILDSLERIGNEVAESALEMDIVLFNNLKKLHKEVTDVFVTTKTKESNDKDDVDLIKSTYYDMVAINEISEKLRKKLIAEPGKTAGAVIKEIGKVPDAIATNALIKTAKRIFPDVDKLSSEEEKQTFFRKSNKTTVAILLYEFATGKGPEIRNFDFHKHKFAQAILSGRVIEEIMDETLKLLRQIDYDFVNKPDSKNLKIGLELSPTLNPIDILDSVDKHLDSNLAQIFIGGAFALVHIKNKKLEGYIFNETGKQSLMLHVADDVARGNTNNVGLSTVKQRIYFAFKLP